MYACSDNISGKNILVAGANGMAGRAIVHVLEAYDCNIIKAGRQDVNLRDAAGTAAFIQSAKADIVIMAAAKVGGIQANVSYPADFIYNNLSIVQNVIHGAYISGVTDLIFLGSSCIYPKLSEQPIKEKALLSGPLEPTNEFYAIAKIAGVKLCEAYSRQYGVNYFSVMPTNLYGPYDNYHPVDSHVIPGLLRRFHAAKVEHSETVTCWGTGTPYREFLYVDDLAKGVVHLANIRKQRQYNIYNIGASTEIAIKPLTQLIKTAVGYAGDVVFDASKPDGAPRKLMDSSRILETGWTPEIDLTTGLDLAYEWFLKNRAEPQ